MALEYVAHEVQQRFLPGVERESSFPICSDLHTFESVMGSRFPGLREVRTDVWDALLRMQPFSDGGYPALGTLNELWHHSKHIDLGGTMTHELVMTFDDPSAGTRETVRRYLLFYAENRPLLELLDRCVMDVGAVIATLETLVNDPPRSAAP